jgi:hypothetical protein
LEARRTIDRASRPGIVPDYPGPVTTVDPDYSGPVTDLDLPVIHAGDDALPPNFIEVGMAQESPIAKILIFGLGAVILWKSWQANKPKKRGRRKR